MLTADAGYGDTSAFRSALDERGIGYIMQVKGDALAHAPGSAAGDAGLVRARTATDPHSVPARTAK